MQLQLTGTPREVDAPATMPLLWDVRDKLDRTARSSVAAMAYVAAAS